MTHPVSQKSESESLFQQVKRTMEQPIRLPDPYTDGEIEALMNQCPLDTDFPNDGMQLPSDEQQEENSNQLHLNYYEH